MPYGFCQDSGCGNSPALGGGAGCRDPVRALQPVSRVAAPVGRHQCWSTKACEGQLPRGCPTEPAPGSPCPGQLRPRPGGPPPGSPQSCSRFISDFPHRKSCWCRHSKDLQRSTANTSETSGGPCGVMEGVFSNGRHEEMGPHFFQKESRGVGLGEALAHLLPGDRPEGGWLWGGRALRP